MTGHGRSSLLGETSTSTLASKDAGPDELAARLTCREAREHQTPANHFRPTLFSAR